MELGTNTSLLATEYKLIKRTSDIYIINKDFEKAISTIYHAFKNEEEQDEKI